MRARQEPGWRVGVAPLAFALGLAACASAFGIDEPQLDECARGGCADGSLIPDAATTGDETGAPPPSDAATGDGATEAAADQESPEIVLCGGGSFPLSKCAGATPICCETVDAGATQYACSASPTDCAGYPISCASGDDCTTASEADGGDGAAPKVCCHFKSNMVCAPPSHCVADRSGVLVCDPEAGSCEAGTSCAPIPSTAYYGCQ